MPVDLTEEFLQDYARLEKENEAWRNGTQTTPALEALRKAHDALQSQYDAAAAQLRDAQAKATNAQRLLQEEVLRHQDELEKKRAKHAEEMREWEQKLANANDVIKEMEKSRPPGHQPMPPPGPLPAQSGWATPPPAPDEATRTRIEELEQQIEDLSKEKGELQTQVNDLTRDKNILEAELSILRPPP